MTRDMNERPTTTDAGIRVQSDEHSWTIGPDGSKDDAGRTVNVADPVHAPNPYGGPPAQPNPRGEAGVRDKIGRASTAEGMASAKSIADRQKA